MELYHTKNEATGRAAADPEIKKAVQAEKFKWFTLQNDPATGKRSQIMQLNRPKEGIPELDISARRMVPGKEPIQIKSGVLF